MYKFIKIFDENPTLTMRQLCQVAVDYNITVDDLFKSDYDELVDPDVFLDAHTENTSESYKQSKLDAVLASKPGRKFYDVLWSFINGDAFEKLDVATASENGIYDGAHRAFLCKLLNLKLPVKYTYKIKDSLSNFSTGQVVKTIAGKKVPVGTIGEIIDVKNVYNVYNEIVDVKLIIQDVYGNTHLTYPKNCELFDKEEFNNMKETAANNKKEEIENNKEQLKKLSEEIKNKWVEINGQKGFCFWYKLNEDNIRLGLKNSESKFDTNVTWTTIYNYKDIRIL